MNRHTWQRKNFVVQSISQYATLKDDNPLAEALADHRNASIPDLVAFRIDWLRFLNRRPLRDQRMAEMLGLGEKANKAAQTLGVCPGRLTQLRQRLREDWIAACL